ncbi:hypothetical protein WS71_20495 [Burkholderia mayonis]|uniref:Uncharacterized protein n=1 Tax=Burkholderia mayonis TaxID=1385591 RepID=A0A1B4G197_9BURK|nr:hypothetical protein WS71_20495 [Burkholderia mayonis]KVE52306.1 hypothetical protein WS71_10320 [Burkholderia mayonis]
MRERAHASRVLARVRRGGRASSRRRPRRGRLRAGPRRTSRAAIRRSTMRFACAPFDAVARERRALCRRSGGLARAGVTSIVEPRRASVGRIRRASVAWVRHAHVLA